MFGYLTFTASTIECENGSDDQQPPRGGPTYHQAVYDYNFVYHDTNGVTHAAPGYVGGCVMDGYDGTNTPYSASPGSSPDGYSLTESTVTLPSGRIISPPVNQVPTGNGMTQDANGNQITESNGVYTDTTGTSVLTVSGGASASSPLVFTYPTFEASASTASTTIYYKTYTVSSNWQCSSITDPGPSSADLIDHITYPDGSQYAFTYETVPGNSSATTARLASVTLPTGGTVTYAYSGTLLGACSNGQSLSGILPKLTKDRSK